jgi:5-methylcytosine-specific restriction endonuclease McrA
MAYNKTTDYWLWKADCLISSFQRRCKKMNIKYDYITSRKEYAEIIKTKLTKCEYCGCKLNKSNLEVDHKIPLSRGGKNNETNLAYVCHNCNAAKGEMTDTEFIELLKVTVKWQDKGDSLFKRLRAAALVFKRRRRFKK